MREQRRSLPDGPGVYLFRDDARQGHLRRQGEVDPQARRRPLLQPVTRGAVEMVDLHRPDRLPARRLRGRGAARRAELHQAVQAALQHPPARRQVLSVHRDLDGRGLPARLLHARAPPPRPRCTSARTRTPRRCAARSTCCRRSSCSAPARAPSRAGAAARRAWTTTSSAAGRPASATSKEEYREAIDGVIDVPLRAATARSSATSKRRMKAAAAAQEFEQAALERNRLRAVREPARAPARRQRVGRHARRGRGRGRRHRRQRAGLPGARRRALRPPVVLPRQRGRAASSARSPRSSSCSTTATPMAIPPQVIVQRDVRRARRSLGEALTERRGARVEVRARRARRQAPDPRARRAQRARSRSTRSA